MKTHYIDKHPEPEKSVSSSPHIRKAFEENRLTLCGQTAATQDVMTEDPDEVTCLECRARINLLRRYENPGLMRDVLNDIIEEFRSFEMEFGTLEEHTTEAGLQILAEDLARVFMQHNACNGLP